jgi:hypothetical protein
MWPSSVRRYRVSCASTTTLLDIDRCRNKQGVWRSGTWQVSGAAPVRHVTPAVVRPMAARQRDFSESVHCCSVHHSSLPFSCLIVCLILDWTETQKDHGTSSELQKFTDSFNADHEYPHPLVINRACVRVQSVSQARQNWTEKASACRW